CPYPRRWRKTAQAACTEND
ncbi:hypothetical protein, partial [Kingella kingae]